MEFKFKYLKVVKRGLGKIVMVSKDGEKWISLEQAYDLVDGDFKLKFGITGGGAAPGLLHKRGKNEK